MNLKKWWGSLPADFTLSKVIFMFLKLLSCVSKFKNSSILGERNRASRSASVFIFEQGKGLGNSAGRALFSNFEHYIVHSDL